MASKKWLEAIFGKILQMTLYTLRVQNFVDMAVSRTVSKINAFFFAFYAEIQYGRQKWGENHFWQKFADNSTHILRVKNFVKIALSHKICEVNAFLHFPSL